MQKKLFLLLSLFAILAINLAAQSNTLKDTSGPDMSNRLNGLEADLTRFLESDDEAPSALERPRIVAPKTSGVMASVIVNTASIERLAFDLLNKKRTEDGRPAMAWSDELAAVARKHSQNMAEFSFFSHRGLDGKMVSDRADGFGVGKWRSIGENIAYTRGFEDPVAKAVQLWLDSPAHRRNLLDNNWKESAVGIAVAPDGSYFFTQVFLQRK